jgi:hypothetical protein
MTPEEIYADRFAEAVVVLMQEKFHPGIPISTEEKAKNKQIWFPIGQAIFRANTGAP